MEIDALFERRHAAIQGSHERGTRNEGTPPCESAGNWSRLLGHLPGHQRRPETLASHLTRTHCPRRTHICERQLEKFWTSPKSPPRSQKRWSRTRNSFTGTSKKTPSHSSRTDTSWADQFHLEEDLLLQILRSARRRTTGGSSGMQHSSRFWMHVLIRITSSEWHMLPS